MKQLNGILDSKHMNSEKSAGCKYNFLVHVNVCANERISVHVMWLHYACLLRDVINIYIYTHICIHTPEQEASADCMTATKTMIEIGGAFCWLVCAEVSCNVLMATDVNTVEPDVTSSETQTSNCGRNCRNKMQPVSRRI